LVLNIKSAMAPYLQWSTDPNCCTVFYDGFSKAIPAQQRSLEAELIDYPHDTVAGNLQPTGACTCGTG
jgi:hypothetical protein